MNLPGFTVVEQDEQDGRTTMLVHVQLLLQVRVPNVFNLKKSKLKPPQNLVDRLPPTYRNAKQQYE